MEPIQREVAAVMQTPTGTMMSELGFAPNPAKIRDYGNVVEVDFVRLPQ